MAQSLEWLQLMGKAAARHRRMDMLENALAARAASATKEGWQPFSRDLIRKINAK